MDSSFDSAGVVGPGNGGQRGFPGKRSGAARGHRPGEAAGIVGPLNGSKPREVLVRSLADLEQILERVGA